MHSIYIITNNILTSSKLQLVIESIEKFRYNTIDVFFMWASTYNSITTYTTNLINNCVQ